MKKLFLVGALALFGAMSAQEYKPMAGDVTTEFGLAGGLLNTSVSLPDQGFGVGPMIKARYFKTDDVAYRMGVVVSNTNESNDNEDSSSNGFALGLSFGAEKHFKGTERLSPYVGGDFILGFASTSSEAGNVKTTGPNGFGLGVRGVFGADYYFAKRVYLGVEAGLGLLYSTTGSTRVDSKEVSKGTSTFKIVPDMVTGVRLGYAF
ncbi:hypothetical protein [Riemerella columbipharyngis]|uniref:Outer membrane protein beta-barrel domain-containing protein n=1 Tax=Riemerella columbipharyngis TaxID=1071918 RepID=A0A1G6YKI1_9FLAO|nr:hypothetical protein [Riemerella columbipharyngis]SDD90812.1 hypothetical protein SAMN05421544_101191 [Riemerella columbipharyngis]